MSGQASGEAFALNCFGMLRDASQFGCLLILVGGVAPAAITSHASYRKVCLLRVSQTVLARSISTLLIARKKHTLSIIIDWTNIFDSFSRGGVALES